MSDIDMIDNALMASKIAALKMMPLDINCNRLVVCGGGVFTLDFAVSMIILLSSESVSYRRLFSDNTYTKGEKAIADEYEAVANILKSVGYDMEVLLPMDSWLEHFQILMKTDLSKLVFDLDGLLDSTEGYGSRFDE